mgnify:CR=1 FL=1
MRVLVRGRWRACAQSIMPISSDTAAAAERTRQVETTCQMGRAIGLQILVPCTPLSAAGLLGEFSLWILLVMFIRLCVGCEEDPCTAAHPAHPAHTGFRSFGGPSRAPRRLTPTIRLGVGALRLQ